MTDFTEVLNDPNYKKVLDKGFVGLIDHMGCDHDIAKSARVSYGAGTKSVRQDTGLIRYLVKHDHTSPIEMGEVKLHVKMPMFVARQWVRHRTACLSGDTILSFSLPTKNDELGTHFPRSIKDICDMWHSKKTQKSGSGKHWKTLGTAGIIPSKIYSPSELAKISGRNPGYFRNNPDGLKITRNNNASGSEPVIQILGQDYLDYIEYLKNKPIPERTINNMVDRIKKMNLRFLNTSTSKVETTHITNIWESGIKDVYEVTLSTGQKIKMTKDHVCYTPIGWLELQKIVNLETGVPNTQMCIVKSKGEDSYKAFDIEIDESKEIWKEINGYNGDYLISNYGRVKSNKFYNSWRLKKQVKRGGYYSISLPKIDDPSKSRVFSIHKLVLETFVGPKPEDKDLIRHLNGNILDNRLENLTYGTHKENSEDTKKHNNTTILRPLFVDIQSVVHCGQEMTYDLTVEAEDHNFIANGIVVHNCMNEVSARYSEMKDDFYIPALENIQPQSLVNNQGRNGQFDDYTAKNYQSMIEDVCSYAYSRYQTMITGKDENTPGLARELARMVLPVNLYTEFYWKQDLKNMLHLIKLRSDPHAQWEIQQYANAIYELIKPIFPETIRAFDDFKRGTTTVTKSEKELVKEILIRGSGGTFKEKSENYVSEIYDNKLDDLLKEYNLSKREFNELIVNWS